MPGSPCLCCRIQNWTCMRWQTWCPRMLDEEGSIGGEHRHITGVATSFQPGGSNCASGARLHIIELVGKHSSFGEEAIFGTKGSSSKEGKERARGASNPTKGRSAGDTAESASGGSCPG